MSGSNEKSVPPLVQRGMPSDGHRFLEPLVGDWDVAMTLFAALGTPDNPYTVKVRTAREWIANGRFLRDVSEGPDYFRQGTLGYSNVDARYEWVTQDAMNANMMIYLGVPGGGPGNPINMLGTFTDQGILGEEMVGKVVEQRTEILITGPDHHTINLFMTPPGGEEMLVDSKVFRRR